MSHPFIELFAVVHTRHERVIGRSQGIRQELVAFQLFAGQRAKVDDGIVAAAHILQERQRLHLTGVEVVRHDFEWNNGLRGRDHAWLKKIFNHFPPL